MANQYTTNMSPEERLIRKRATKRAYALRNKTKVNAQKNAWRRKNLDKAKEYNRLRYLRKKELILRNTIESAKRRLVKRAGRPKPVECEIPSCNNTHKISFDHCHTTGKFRGWICGKCNVALGILKDNPRVLRDLADYLEKQ